MTTPDRIARASAYTSALNIALTVLLVITCAVGFYEVGAVLDGSELMKGH